MFDQELINIFLEIGALIIVRTAKKINGWYSKLVMWESFQLVQLLVINLNFLKIVRKPFNQQSGLWQ